MSTGTGTGTGTGYGGPPIDLSDLALKIITDPEFVTRLKSNPREALGEVAKKPLESDVWIYRIVVISLGLTILTTAVGFIYITLSATSKEPPAGLVALGSGAIGALAGLLAPSPASKS